MSVRDEIRAQLADALWREFGSFIAHDPDKPDMFWRSTADGLIRSEPIAGLLDRLQAVEAVIERAHGAET